MRDATALLTSRWLVGLCRIAIGVVFVAAALSKIGDPAAFATQIHNFRLAPTALENLVAALLPWVELLAGLALVLHVRARAGAWLALAMMAVFTVAVAIAMARHLDFQCGCFGTMDATRVGAKKLLENLVLTGTALVASLRSR
jgi:putative oxidoreductase